MKGAQAKEEWQFVRDPGRDQVRLPLLLVASLQPQGSLHVQLWHCIVRDPFVSKKGAYVSHTCAFEDLVYVIVNRHHPFLSDITHTLPQAMGYVTTHIMIGLCGTLGFPPVRADALAPWSPYRN